MALATEAPSLAYPGQGWRGLLGASLGSAIEWYDFFLYAMLAVHFSAQFFPRADPAGGLLLSLATFGAGFVVRPLGALLFGSIGDRKGRKLTFLITVTLMGVSTAAVGFIPTFAQIGWWAPLLLVASRLVQGLSVGGEYGGAATYVGEHAPVAKRGARTGWLQMTVTGGQLFAILVIMTTQAVLGPARFDAWGWRLPFLLSVLLLGVSVYIRFGLEESPVFRALQEAKRTSRSPIKDSVSEQGNLHRIFVALLLCAGQGVLGYTGALYPVFFLTGAIHLDHSTVNILTAIAVAISLPFQPFFGWLSDRIGRKWLMLGACLIAAFSYLPAYHALMRAGHPALADFQERTVITLASDRCGGLFSGGGTDRPCDAVRAQLNGLGLPFATAPGIPGQESVLTVGPERVSGADPAAVRAALRRAGFPERSDPARRNLPLVCAILTGLAILGAMIFGPLAAFLIEQFPAEIRYTSIGIAYNFGTGWFGGLAPFVISAIALGTGDIYKGLWAPSVFAGGVFLLGAWLISAHRPAPDNASKTTECDATL